MTAPLQHEYKAVNSIAFAIAWFKPLGANNAIGPKPWNANKNPKPYRWVTRPTGSRTCDSDYPVLWVHTLAGNSTDPALNWAEASREADRTDNRALVLVDYPGWPTTLPDGRVVQCDWCEITEAAHEEPYAAETVAARFVTELRLGISLVTA